MIREFHLMEETYKKIFTRLGLDFRVVEADSGAIGGSGSKEFHVLANSGEDTLVVCDSCDYAANIEAAKRKPKEIKGKRDKVKEKVLTPNVTSIEDVSKFLDIEPSQTIKAVIKKAIYEDTQKVAVFFVRGDDELEETKATNAVDALELVDANEEDIKDAGLVAGYVGLFALPKNVIVIIDNELKDENNLVCGANEENYHLTGVDLKELTDIKYDDLVAVQPGDRCSCCGGELTHTKGIEVGHIFQLGTKYSASMNANFLDRNGKARPFIMGTYGIGVSRLISAVIEQHHDDKGMIWTKETAPFTVDIIVSNAKNEDEISFANHLYDALHKFKIETILDDRIDARYGFKMGDFELIGFPYGVIVGKKLTDGIVEIVDRKTLQKIEVQKHEVVAKLMELIG
jgi:prolyl-tRNA synthetase